MKKLPPMKEVEEVLLRASTDSVSVTWVQRKFNLGFNDAKALFEGMKLQNFITTEGVIKIDQYPRDEF